MGQILSLLIVTAVAAPAAAKDFAFVLAGEARATATKHHELIAATMASSLCLRDAGYDVRTLVGAADPADPQLVNDGKNVFVDDYKFLDKHVPYTPSTVQNIDKRMKDLVRDVKAERAKGEPVRVEIIVNAHGRSNCLPDREGPEEGGYLPQAGSPPSSLRPPSTGRPPMLRPPTTQDCRHQIQVFDGQKSIWMDSRELKSHIAEMEAAGARVTLNLNSCNAGASKKDFDALGGTCTYYGTIEESFATACNKNVEEDVRDGWWNSNTSVNMYRACAGRFDDLMDKKYGGYFADDACFRGLKKHIEDKKIDLSSVANAYFSERRESTSFEASGLSCFNEDFINKSAIGGAIYQKQEICREDEQVKMKTFVGTLNDAMIDQAWKDYDGTIDAYNAAVRAQHDLKPIDVPLEALSESEARKLAELQTEAKRLGDKLIRAERALVDRVYRLQPERFQQCHQGPCGGGGTR